MSIYKVIAFGGTVLLAACQTTTSGGGTSQSASKDAVGFQNHRAIIAEFSGKSAIPDNNGLAFYFAPDGILHTQQLFRNGSSTNPSDHYDYTPGKPSKATRPAFTIGENLVPAAPALCIPQNLFFPKKDPAKVCVTFFKTADGEIFVPESNSFLTLSEGSGAFQASVHHEGKLRDIPAPIPAWYGNISKYGGVGKAYMDNFPDDLVAQKITLDLKAHIAQATKQNAADLAREIAEVEARYAERAAARERAKIEAAQAANTQRAKEAAARRAAREARCQKNTGKPCTSGGGMLGWLLTSTAKAIASGSSGGSSSGPAPTYSLNYDLELICRERNLMDVDNFKRILQNSCAGTEQSCVAQYEQQISARFGSLNKACTQSFGPSYSYESIDVDY